MGKILYLAITALVFTLNASIFAQSNPVSVWNAEGNANDSAGANHGSVGGGAGYSAAGYSGQAFNLNGSSQYVTVPNNASLNTANFSVEGWFYFTQPPSGAVNSSQEYVLLSKYGGNYDGWILRMGNDMKPVLTLAKYPASIATAITSFLRVELNKWVRITGTYDGTTLKLYVNGALVGTGALSGGYSASTGALTFGAASWTGGARYMTGLIDSVQFFSRALTKDEVQGLVSYWPAENTANDTVGANNGTLQNGVTFTTGNNGQAFSLNGANQSVSVTNNSSLNSAAFSVEGWFYLAQSPSGGVFQAGEWYLASKYGGAYNGWILRIGSELKPTISVARDANNWVNVNSSIPIELNKWAKITATYDGALLNIYVNGIRAGGGVLSGGYTASSGALAIGTASWASQGFVNGRADDVRFYRRALTEWETIEGLVSYWPANSTAADVIGSNSGTFTGGQYLAGVDNQSASAFSFSGATQVSAANNSTLNSSLFTVEAWCLITQAPSGALNSGNEYVLLNKYGGNYDGWIIRIGNDLKPAFSVARNSGGATSAEAVSTKAVDLNQWVKISATYDGTKARIYLNGVLRSEVSFTSGYTPSSGSFVIGAASWYSGLYARALVDNVMFYKRALSSGEIAAEAENEDRFIVASPAYGGLPFGVTGSIDAEQFNKGGNGVGYYDTDLVNEGGGPRPRTGVDIFPCDDLGGGFYIGKTKPGEWLTYLVYVPVDGNYTFQFRARGLGGSFHVDLGTGSLGAVAVDTRPAPNQSAVWKDVVAYTGVHLTPGHYTIKIAFDTATGDGNVMDLNHFSVYPTLVFPAPASYTVQGSTLGLFSADSTKGAQNRQKLQNAINLIAANSGGGTLVLPSGTFFLEQEDLASEWDPFRNAAILITNSNVRVQGAGSGANGTVLKAKNRSTSIFAVRSHLVSKWSEPDSTQNATLAMDSGWNFHANLRNGVSLVDNVSPYGKAFHLSGLNGARNSSQYLDFTTPQYCSTSMPRVYDPYRCKKFTFRTQVRFSQAPSGLVNNPGEYILASRYYNLAGWILRMGDNRKPVLQVLGSGSQEVTSPVAIALNTWTEITASYDGTTLRLWTGPVGSNNSQLQSSYVSASFAGYIPAVSTIKLTFGAASWAATGYMDGDIDEMAFYDAALTPDEINGIQAPSNIQISDLVLEGSPEVPLDCVSPDCDPTNGLYFVFNPGCWGYQNNGLGSLLLLQGLPNAPVSGVSVTACTLRNGALSAGFFHNSKNVLFRDSAIQFFAPDWSGAPSGNPDNIGSHAGLLVDDSLTSNFLVISNYFDGNVHMTVPGTEHTADGMIWFITGGNYFISNNRIKNYKYEGIQLSSGPYGVVGNNYSTLRNDGGVALATTRVGTGSLLVLLPQSPYSYFSFIGNQVGDGSTRSGFVGVGAGDLSVNGGMYLNCSGNFFNMLTTGYQGSSGGGLALNAASNILVTANTVLPGYDGMTLGQGNQYVTISGNNFGSQYRFGLFVADDGGALGTDRALKSLIVSDNVFTLGQKHIQLDNSAAHFDMFLIRNTYLNTVGQQTTPNIYIPVGGVNIHEFDY